MKELVKKTEPQKRIIPANTPIGEVGILNFDPITYYYNELWEKKKTYLKTREAKILFWQMPKDIMVPFKNAFLNGIHIDEIEESEEVKNYFLQNSVILSEMAKNPTGFKSMEYFYCPVCKFTKPIDTYCWHSLTGQSLRNRLSSTVDFLIHEIDFYIQIYGQANVLNLGSGLGRDSVLAYRHNPKLRKRSRTVCVDIDSSAVAAGEKLIIEQGIKTNIKFYRENILNLSYKQKFDLGLLVGILCPLSDRAAVKVLKKIKKYFRPGSKLLTVILTEEMLVRDLLSSYICHEITGWKKLKFREKRRIKNLLEIAGYKWGGGWSEPSTCFYDFGVGIIP